MFVLFAYPFSAVPEQIVEFFIISLSLNVALNKSYLAAHYKIHHETDRANQYSKNY